MANSDVRTAFNALIDKLAEDLEARPDPWFLSPKGWLLKAPFTRPEQDRSNHDQNGRPVAKRGSTVFSSISSLVKQTTGSVYQRRWFVLNVERRFLAYYHDESPSTPESGFIDLRNIVDVQVSKMDDAPPFALDLVSRERYFTVAAESQQQMVKWAYALNSCRQSAPGAAVGTAVSKQAPPDPAATSRSGGGEDRWTKYEYTYMEKGPLMLNVMGTTNKDSKTGKVINNWIIVTSFEPTADGRPGRSEASGVISVKDYLVAVNGVDLRTYTFNESMEIIGKATFPKTVQFLRDKTVDRTASRAEGWAVVFYPSLNRKRRRYVDVRLDAINFRKPAPGGSANAERDACLRMDQIARIKPIFDKTMPADQQYILRLLCRDGAMLDHIGDEDKTVGTSAVEYVDLCFAKDSQMKNWRSVLVSPSIYANAATAATIPVMDLETIDVKATTSTGDASSMAIKSALNGQFAPRTFTISGGSIHWTRPTQKSGARRSMEIANSFGCKLRSARAVEVAGELRHPYRYQLVLQSADGQAATVGMKDEATLLRWLGAVRDAVAIAPAKTIEGVYVSNAVERRDADDDDDGLVNSMGAMGLTGNESQSGVQGYLYKRSNSVMNTANAYNKRWFVLSGYTLAWFKNNSEAAAGIYPTGWIDLRSVYEVRESVDPLAPENSIDIVGNGKVTTVAASDESDLNVWLDALADTLELREMAIQTGDPRDGTPKKIMSPQEAEAQRIAAIRSAVVHSGLLHMRGTGGLMKSPWKQRFCVIASGAFTYYENQNDMFDENKDSKGEIALANILVVETCNDAQLNMNTDHVFDIHARVIEGGDSSGMRKFTFDARTADVAETWMKEICRATEVLELRRSTKGVGWASAVSSEMVKEKNAKALRAKAGIFAATSPIGTSNSPLAPRPAGEASYATADGSEADNDESDAGGGGGGGSGGDGRAAATDTNRRRAGMGRGHAFRGGSSTAAAKIGSGAWQGHVAIPPPPAPGVGGPQQAASSGRDSGLDYGALYGDGGL